jgi:hypothetical protein
VRRVARRWFVQGVGVVGLGLLAGCGRLPGQAPAPTPMRRIGYLVGDPADAHGYAVFREGLVEQGLIEAKLRAKPGGEAIPVIMGDFAEVSVQGSYSLVFVVFNTFFALASQEEQVRCFQNVARHLAADGAFVIQAFVPDLTRFDHGQRTAVTGVQADRVIVEASCHDPVQQRISGQQIVLRESGITLYPVQIRYAWPAELDLMARLAGLSLRERWESWQRVPFTASSGRHVSVYAAARDQTHA